MLVSIEWESVRLRPQTDSEILTHGQNLNEKFIDVVEKIHMKQRMMGVSFSLKCRDSKNRYINSQMKDGLYELDADLVNYAKYIVMRKLLITYLSLHYLHDLLE